MCVCVCKKCKSSPYSIVEHRVPELILVLGSQLAGDMSHEPSGRLPLLSTRPTVTLATLKRAGCYQFRCLVNRGTMGVNSLPKTVTRQRRGCDLNAGPSVPEISTLTSWLLSHTCVCVCVCTLMNSCVLPFSHRLQATQVPAVTSSQFISQTLRCLMRWQVMAEQ